MLYEYDVKNKGETTITNYYKNKWEDAETF